MINIIAIIVSVISLGVSAYLYFIKYMYNKNTDKTLKTISRLANELADNVPQNLKGELENLSNISNKALSGVISLVNSITTNNKHYLKITMDNKYVVGKYREHIPTLFSALTNSLISVDKVKITPNSIYISIPFGGLFIDIEKNEIKQSGEFEKFDLTFMK